MKSRIIKGMKKSVAVLLLAVSLVSCDDNRVFDKFKSLEGASWLKDQKVLFYFDVKDTLSKRNLYINLRNNDSYEFSNLFMITHLNFPNGKQIIDTLEYNMTDNYGKFLGSGFTSLKENKLLYKEGVVFPLLGTYNITIQQAMRRNGIVNGVNTLKGITEIGFRIEK